MIPLSDDNPTLRTPLMTYALLAGTLGGFTRRALTARRGSEPSF